MVRIRLQREELEEMEKTLLEGGSIVDLADDLADQYYILAGTVNAYGLQKYMEACFDEVHSSNMSKAHTSEELAAQTLMYWEKEKGYSNCQIKEVNGLWVVLSEEGKLLKNIHYRKADLAPILASEAVFFSEEEIEEGSEMEKQDILKND